MKRNLVLKFWLEKKSEGSRSQSSSPTYQRIDYNKEHKKKKKNHTSYLNNVKSAPIISNVKCRGKTQQQWSTIIQKEKQKMKQLNACLDVMSKKNVC